MKTKKNILFVTLVLLLVSSSFSKYLTPHLKRCPQWKSSWCWAGAAQGCLTFYGIGQDKVSNQDCAHVITTQNKPQSMRVITTIINKFLPGYASSPKKDLTSEAAFKREADKNAPFACFYPGHFVTYAGYEGNKHLIMNPWPWGTDSSKHGKWEENLTYNYIANKTSSYVRTKGKPPTQMNDNTNLVVEDHSFRVITSSNKKKIEIVLPALKSSRGKLVLYNSNGKTVYERKVREKVQSIHLNLNSLTIAGGMYIVEYSAKVNKQLFKSQLFIE